MFISREVSWAEFSSARRSSSRMRSPISRTRASMEEVSSPFFLSMPICLEVALRSDCKACFSVSALRRASSHARTSSTSFHASPLRGFKRAFTSSGFSRITRMSSITRTACTPSLRHASQMNGLSWKNCTCNNVPFAPARRGYCGKTRRERRMPWNAPKSFLMIAGETAEDLLNSFRKPLFLCVFPGCGSIARRGKREFFPVFSKLIPFHPHLFLKSSNGRG